MIKITVLAQQYPSNCIIQARNKIRRQLIQIQKREVTSLSKQEQTKKDKLVMKLHSH